MFEAVVLIPAPEDRHYVADDVVFPVHRKMCGLGSLGQLAALLQPRVGRRCEAEVHRTPVSLSVCQSVCGSIRGRWPTGPTRQDKYLFGDEGG
jgi:hypothetical protein